MHISFPLNETSFLFTFIHVQSTHIVASTAQTDLYDQMSSHTEFQLQMMF